MEWHDWITDKYLEWRGESIGRGGSISAFARWLDVKQQVVSAWINDGAVPASSKYVNALVSRYGGEVYDVLGIAPALEVNIEDQAALNEIARILRDVPREKHGELVFAVRAWAKQNGYTIIE